MSTENAKNLIRKYIEELNGVHIIAPPMLAKLALEELDPEKSTPVEVEELADHALRQIARDELRRVHDPIEKDDPHPDMFDGLQDRYPCADKKGYILRVAMSLEDRTYNITRLKKEAKAKTEHATALQAETDHLLAAGNL